jgi:hypothetical protein
VVRHEFQPSPVVQSHKTSEPYDHAHIAIHSPVYTHTLNAPLCFVLLLECLVAAALWERLAQPQDFNSQKQTHKTRATEKVLLAVTDAVGMQEMLLVQN